MTQKRIISPLLMLALLVAGPVPAQTPAADEYLPEQTSGASERLATTDPQTVEGFREVLLTYALSLERALGLDPKASEAISNASYEEMGVWLDHQVDLDRFVYASERLVAQLDAAAAAADEGNALAEPDTPEFGVDAPLTPPFNVDYPPNSGDYKATITDTVNILGIPASNTSRCSTPHWDNFYTVWYLTYKTLGNLDGACTVAGCDPIGIICAAVCAPLEIAAIFLETAAVPIDLCDVHGATVDGAEIEAAYENSVRILNDIGTHDGNLSSHNAALSSHNTALTNHNAALGTHDGNLSSHDANIDADLAAHDANIDADLAAHDANIDADLAAHDANIDADLVAHDTDIKALLAGVKGDLENKVELRRVHLQVLELKNRSEYLVATTEAGEPVDVQFTALEVFDEAAVSFVAIPTASVTMVEAGLYVVALNLSPQSPDKVFRFRARHDEIVDHYGEVIFHREASGNLGSGQ